MVSGAAAWCVLPAGGVGGCWLGGCSGVRAWAGCSGAAALGACRCSPPCGRVFTDFSTMELQSGVPGAFSPAGLSPTLGYSAASPGLGGPGPSQGGVSGPLNYNQLEGRFKQLQGKRSLLQASPPLLWVQPLGLGRGWGGGGGVGGQGEACLGDVDESAGR